MWSTIAAAAAAPAAVALVEIEARLTRHYCYLWCPSEATTTTSAHSRPHVSLRCHWLQLN